MSNVGGLAGESEPKLKKLRVEESPVSLAKQTGSNYFNHLNNDCFLQIFKYLSIKQRLDVATVCTRWRDASQLAWNDIKVLDFRDPSPWKEDTEELPSTYRTNECIARILTNCGSSLRQLQLDDHVDSNILQIVGHHCCNLTRLEIDVSKCGRISAKFILPLQNLKYFRVKGNGQDFFGDVLEALPRETLTEIHLVVNGAEPFKTSRTRLPWKAPQIFAHLTHLTAITLEGFFLEATGYDSYGNILRVLSHKNDLSYLSLAHCSTDMDLSPLARLKNLTHLNLYSVDVLHDNMIINMSKNCHELRYLNLGSTRVTDRGIQSLADLPQLQELELHSAFFVKGSAFRELRHLRKLNIDGCCSISDYAITRFLRCADNLVYLNLVHAKVDTRYVLRAAARTTKLRINNTKLEVIVEPEEKYYWTPYAIFSPLLIVNVEEEEKERYYEATSCLRK